MIEKEGVVSADASARNSNSKKKSVLLMCSRSTTRTLAMDVALWCVPPRRRSMTHSRPAIQADPASQTCSQPSTTAAVVTPRSWLERYARAAAAKDARELVLATLATKVAFGRVAGPVQDKRMQVRSRTISSRTRGPARRCILMLTLSSQRMQNTAIIREGHNEEGYD